MLLNLRRALTIACSVSTRQKMPSVGSIPVLALQDRSTGTNNSCISALEVIDDSIHRPCDCQARIVRLNCRAHRDSEQDSPELLMPFFRV